MAEITGAEFQSHKDKIDDTSDADHTSDGTRLTATLIGDRSQERVGVMMMVMMVMMRHTGKSLNKTGGEAKRRRVSRGVYTITLYSNGKC